MPRSSETNKLTNKLMPSWRWDKKSNKAGKLRERLLIERTNHLLLFPARVQITLATNVPRFRCCDADESEAIWLNFTKQQTDLASHTWIVHSALQEHFRPARSPARGENLAWQKTTRALLNKATVANFDGKNSWGTSLKVIAESNFVEGGN